MGSGLKVALRKWPRLPLSVATINERSIQLQTKAVLMIAATSWTYQRSCAKAKRNNATSSIVQAPCLSRHCYTHSSNRKHSPHNGKKQNFFSVKSLSVNKRCGRKETICSCPMLSCIPLPNQMLVNWKSSM